jgi:hypothetical protein
MASILVNGTRRASSLRVLLPRVGVWTADLAVDDGEPLAGRVSVAVEGLLTLSGTVLRGGVGAEVWTGRLVGGVGGLRRELDALPHRSVTLADVFAQALSDAGETAAPSLGDLSATYAHWIRRAAPAAHAVGDVARALGYAWRVLPDGSVWIGAESWPAYAPADVEFVAWDDRAGTLTLAGSTLGVLPGQALTVGARTVRVGAVEHHVGPETLRTIVATEDA